MMGQKLQLSWLVQKPSIPTEGPSQEKSQLGLPGTSCLGVLAGTILLYPRISSHTQKGRMVQVKKWL